MEFNLADLFEQAVDHFGDRECVVAEGKRRTYVELDRRANRLAHHLVRHGIRPGDHVGIYAYNCVEWVEVIWAVFKIRAIWININYRYVEDELRYLFTNADLRALVYQRGFAPRVLAVRDAMPGLAHSIVIDDGSDAEAGALGSAAYEEALGAESPERDFPQRSGDDRYILYTGGTTGMPKGVVWRHEDVFMVLGGGIDPATGEEAKRPEDMIARAAQPGPRSFLPIAPLMHGATQWSVMGGSFLGRKNVLVARFRPDEVWRLVDTERVEAVMITGDAMGRPLVEVLDAGREQYDLSSFVLLVSSAAVFSPTVKDDFFRHFPDLLIVDSIGSSEGGNNGTVLVTRGSPSVGGGGPSVSATGGTVVLDDSLRRVEPGSPVVGRLARCGHIPLEYYGDPRKSAETFVVGADGLRYAIPGDFARVEADGRITLLGRGSVCINSGGEKIYPEEVEAAIKAHPDVYDAVVVGVPDSRWGSRVAAVVQPRPGTAPTLESIQAHCRVHIAGYKIPRQLHLVAELVRSPAGKADYPWAQHVATGGEQ